MSKRLELVGAAAGLIATLTILATLTLWVVGKRVNGPTTVHQERFEGPIQVQFSRSKNHTIWRAYIKGREYRIESERMIPPHCPSGGSLTAYHTNVHNPITGVSTDRVLGEVKCKTPVFKKIF